MFLPNRTRPSQGQQQGPELRATASSPLLSSSSLPPPPRLPSSTTSSPLPSPASIGPTSTHSLPALVASSSRRQPSPSPSPSRSSSTSKAEAAPQTLSPKPSSSSSLFSRKLKRPASASGLFAREGGSAKSFFSTTAASAATAVAGSTAASHTVAAVAALTLGEAADAVAATATAEVLHSPAGAAQHRDSPVKAKPVCSSTPAHQVYSSYRSVLPPIPATPVGELKFFSSAVLGRPSDCQGFAESASDSGFASSLGVSPGTRDPATMNSYASHNNGASSSSSSSSPRVVGRGGAGGSMNLPGSAAVSKLGAKVTRKAKRPVTPTSLAAGDTTAPSPASSLSNYSIASPSETYFVPPIRQPSLSARQRMNKPRPSSGGSVGSQAGDAGLLPPGRFRRLSSEYTRPDPMSSDIAASSLGEVDAQTTQQRWADVVPPSADDPSVQGQSLPVRMGVVPPHATATDSGATSNSGSSSSKRGPKGARYQGGFYLCTPPPFARRRSFSNGSLALVTEYGWPPAETSSMSYSVSSHPHDEAEQRLPLAGRQNSESLANSPLLSSRSASATLKRRDTNSSMKRPSVPRDRSATTTTLPDPGWEEAPLPTTDASVIGDSEGRNDEWDLDAYWTYKEERVASGGTRRIRYHAFSKEDVPYFISHDQHAVNAELYAHNIVYNSLSFRHSIIPFGDEKPLRVLDLGTGTGAWCVDAARDWKETEFVGLDVVPCQSPLDCLEDGADLSKRISWVVANFLEELPFPSSSFDFVHIRGLGATCIREDQWPDLLSEIVRVLKPEGHLELLEWNWNFTGNLRNVSIQEIARMTKSTHAGTPAASAPRAEPSGSFARVPSAPESIPQPAPKPYAGLEEAFDKMLANRFINPRVLTLIPSNLTSQNLTEIRLGNPRRIPLAAKQTDFQLLTELSQRAHAASAASGMAAAAPASPQSGKDVGRVHGGQDEEKEQQQAAPTDPRWADTYTMRTQVGRPLEDSGFYLPPDQLALLRSISILAHSEKHYGARDAVWDECEEARRMSNASIASKRSVNRDQGARRSQPWRERGNFDAAMRLYSHDMHEYADMGTLMQSKLGWKTGKLESVAERKMGEKQRKLQGGIRSGQYQEGKDGPPISPILGGNPEEDVRGSPEPTSAAPSASRTSSPAVEATGPVRPDISPNSSLTLGGGDEKVYSPTSCSEVDPVASALSVSSPKGGESELPDSSSRNEPVVESPQRASRALSPAAESTPRTSSPSTQSAYSSQASSLPSSSVTSSASPAPSLGPPPPPSPSPMSIPMYVPLVGLFETTGYSARAPHVKSPSPPPPAL